MEQNNELVIEIKMLRIEMNNLTKRYNTLNLFFGGMMRGIGLIVGATLFVLVGSMVLSLLGYFPALSEIVDIIRESFEKAQLQ